MKIIDNKKIEMTEEEFQMYRGICKSYDKINQRGEDFFKDLFETDDNGIIICINPPSKRYSSMECIFFIQNLQLQQFLRLAARKIDRICGDLKQEKDKAIELRKELEKVLNAAKEKV